MVHRFIRARAGALLLALLGTTVAAAAPVDINSADAATLARDLKGVGANKAATIVEYRRTHGGFKTLDDLALVKGIGAKLVERNRADLRLGRFVPGAAGAAPVAAAGQAGGRTVLARPVPGTVVSDAKGQAKGQARAGGKVVVAGKGAPAGKSLQ